MQKSWALEASPADPQNSAAITNFWLRACVIELLSGTKYNTAFGISNLRCAHINAKIIITPPLN